MVLSLIQSLPTLRYSRLVGNCTLKNADFITMYHSSLSVFMMNKTPSGTKKHHESTEPGNLQAAIMALVGTGRPISVLFGLESFHLVGSFLTRALLKGPVSWSEYKMYPCQVFAL